MIKRFLQFLKKKVLDTAPVVLSAFLILFCGRALETVLIGQSQFVEDIYFAFIEGLQNDLKALVLIWPILIFIPFHLKFAKHSTQITIGTLLLIGILSSFYFVLSLQILDRTVYQFTIEELVTIIRTFGEFKWYYLLIVLPIPLLYLLKKLFSSRKKLSFTILAIFFVAAVAVNFVVEQKKQKNNLEELLVKNKIDFFIQDSYDYFFSAKNNNEAYQYNKQDSGFPLSHPPSEENPLGKYFELKETPPNFVFLIIESLSSVYSGPQAKEISFTPYLDSLATQSLYFTHFLASSERTFGVFPSSLASLPHGEKGFNALQLNMPNHHSIPSILVDNDYEGHFFYGGDSHYDYMRTFMENNGITNFVEHLEYNYEGTGLKLSTDEIPFGVSDQVLFKEVANGWKNKLKAPFFHIYLTLSMHHPFNIESQDHYIEKAKRIIDQYPNSDGLNKEKYYKALKMFSTSVFTDEGIRFLMKAYQKEKEYENTIFLIYGDHMFGPIAKKNALEKYITPLYIYSPLLKSSTTVNAFNTHNDLAPSILSLIKEEYPLQTPENVHWLGKPFDMSKKVNRNRQLLFMLNNRETEDFITDSLFLSQGKVYRLDNNLDLSPVNNQQIEDSVIALRDSIKNLHVNVINKNKLIKLEEELHLIKRIHLNGLQFSQKQEYVTLFDKTLNKDRSSLLIEIKLDFEKEEQEQKVKKHPLLVLRYKDEITSELFLWQTIPYDSTASNQRYTIDLNKFFKSNSKLPLEKDNNLKIYFWNQKESMANFKINQGSITLKGTKK